MDNKCNTRDAKCNTLLAKSPLSMNIINELPNVVFEPAEKEFYDYEFIPNGVKKENREFYRFDETALFTETFHEILIMSPFLSGGIIRCFKATPHNTSAASSGKFVP